MVDLRGVLSWSGNGSEHDVEVSVAQAWSEADVTVRVRNGEYTLEDRKL